MPLNSRCIFCEDRGVINFLRWSTGYSFYTNTIVCQSDRDRFLQIWELIYSLHARNVSIRHVQISNDDSMKMVFLRASL